jgi:hypothetical protein
MFSFNVIQLCVVLYFRIVREVQIIPLYRYTTTFHWLTTHLIGKSDSSNASD